MEAKPEDFIASLVADWGDIQNTIVFQPETCSEEIAVEKAVKEQALLK